MEVEYGTGHGCKCRQLLRVLRVLQRSFTHAQKFTRGIGLRGEALQVAIVQAV